MDTEYNQHCHYEMRDRAKAQYRKDMLAVCEANTPLDTLLMSDFDGKGYVSVKPFLPDTVKTAEEVRAFNEEMEVVYNFAYLASLPKE